MPYKHGVTGSSPVVPTKFGPVVQSVSTPACHAGGRRFESVRGRHKASVESSALHKYASVAQSVEQWTENPRVVGSIPTGGTRCGCSSSGRAPPCQGGGSEFEPRHPLQIRYRGQVVRQESAKLSFTRSNRVGTSKNPEYESVRDFTFYYSRKNGFAVLKSSR